MHKKPLALLEKVNGNSALMLQKLFSIIELSTVEGKPKETLAVEILQIESNAATIIRLAEELLTVTRTLKENWILGQLKLDDDQYNELERNLDLKMNDLIEKVSSVERTVIR
ncbi:hypothetical protein BABINDRAFT_8104 [Babjeviella inositovora NRRL Y-12698]|uniref:Mediator of RNA polymerase II transcription subunit 22 n=1 Tax=Babjeviella inositovora NRRL Y-12698 TaxID=984486 RepID=A0A1E3QQZ2_9ASCO|nr:uncharacterized protein BABINDRAFT_8104 [Babjeviella inositovora NRRL Y-12698]ODQ79914.1 hypothetical protein BABINDRAFT_8104 [Babjeviella inositovora NRRL Y-12698]